MGIFSEKKIRTLMIMLSERKYYVITTFIGLVHALFGVIFFLTGVIPMAVFNVFSPIIYLSMRGILKRGKLVVFLFFAYMEIIVHAVLTAYFVGGNSGFGQYIIAVVPLGFLGAYEVVKGRKRFTVPLILGIVASTIYILCRQYSYHTAPVYVLPESLEESLFIFNSTGTFVFLLCALLLYTITLNDMEQ